MNHPPDADDKLARSSKELDVLLERYKMCISEAQNLRLMLHNVTNFVFVTIGALTAYMQFRPQDLDEVLLFAPLPLLLLHLGHLMESHNYLANIELIVRLDKRICELIGITDSKVVLASEEKTLMQVRGETSEVKRMRDIYRNGVHLLPSLGAIVWWSARSLEVRRSIPEMIMLGADYVLLIASFVAWLHVKKTLDKSWGGMPVTTAHADRDN